MKAQLFIRRVNPALQILSVLVVSLFIISAFTEQAGAFLVPPEEGACIFIENRQNPLVVKDASPNSKVKVFTGFKKGNATIQSGNCAGTEIGIKPNKKIATLKMNNNGNKNGKIYIPPTSENKGFMQLLDMNTCIVGDVRDVIYTRDTPGKRCVYRLPTCPCFDASDVEGVGIDFMAEVLNSPTCIDSFPDQVILFGDRPGDGDSQLWDAEAFPDPIVQECILTDEEFGISEFESNLTDAEHQACQQIIRNSEMWELNCPDEGDVRLVNGTASSGRVEVFHDGQWGTVCDDSWNITDANVVCQQLGFPSASIAHRQAFFGEGIDPIWMDNVLCTGAESRLVDCLFNGFGNHNCQHREDAGVTCNTP